MLPRERERERESKRLRRFVKTLFRVGFLIFLLFFKASSPALATSPFFSDDFSSGSSNWIPLTGAWIAESGEYRQKSVAENSYDSVTTYFQDSFTEPDGQASQWSVKRGTFAIASNEYTTTSTNVSLSIPTTDSLNNLSDYRIKAKIKRLGAADIWGYEMIYFRLSMVDATKDNSYALLLRQTGIMNMYIRADGNFSGVPIANATLAKDNNYHNVIITVIGTTIRVWVDKTEDQIPDISVIDSTYSSGTVGVGANAWNSISDDISIENTMTINPIPPHLYTDSSSTFTISSNTNLDNLQLTVTDPTNTTWTVNNPSGCAGNKSCQVVFPTDFSGATISTLGTYVLSATNGSDVSKTLIEIREKPLVSFIDVTDTHVQASGADLDQLGYLVDDINNKKYFPLPDFVVLTGDLTEKGTTAGLNAIKTKLDTLTIPYYPVIGNHEVDSETGDDRGHMWSDVFGADKFTYSWTLGDYLFLGMDRNAPYGGYGSDLNSTAHLNWLQNILDTNSSKYTFLFTHHGLQQVRDSGGGQAFWTGETVSSTVRALLEAHGKPVINFSGHSHLNGLVSTNGIYYVQSPGFINVDEYRYVEIYSDRVESHILKKQSYDDTYSGQYWAGSTDSTHTSTLYNYGLPIERQFKIDLVSKTSDIEDSEAVAGNTAWRDYTYQIDITLSNEGVLGENIGGLIFRYTDTNNYYDVVLDSAKDKIILEKKLNGAFTQIASVSNTIDIGTSYTPKVTVQGTSIKVYLGDVLKIDTTDSAFSTGKVGLKTYRASTSYDNVSVTDLASPTAFDISTPSNNSWSTTKTPTLSWSASSDPESGISKYQLYTDGTLNRDNISSSATSTTPATGLSDGDHTWYIVAVDISGNTTQSTSIQTIRIDSITKPGAQVCGDQAPGTKAPWLYSALSESKDSIRVYFTDAQDPVNKYVLEYGTSSGTYQFSSVNIGGKGTKTYLVEGLSPNTTYYFRVRAGNGCATGPWSNEMSAKTKSLATSTTEETEEAKELQPGAKEEISKPIKPETPLTKMIETPKKLATFLKNTGAGIGNFVGNIFRYTKETVVSGYKTLAQGIKKPKEFVSRYGEWISYSIVSFREIVLDKEPTKISDVKVEKLTSTSAVVYWKTNHLSDSKVNWGETLDYGKTAQKDEKVHEHRIEITELEPESKYFYEVMSQNKNYVYDANHEFTTPKE